MRERPRFLRKQAKRKLWMAAAIANSASAPEELQEGDRVKVQRLRDEARQLTDRRLEMQRGCSRAARRPATHRAREASGAQPDEPIESLARVLLCALVMLGAQRELADKLISHPGGDQGGEKGKKGKKGREIRNRGKGMKKGWGKR